MPTVAVTVGKKQRNVVSAPLLATMLRAHDPAEIWLEKVSTRPGEVPWVPLRSVVVLASSRAWPLLLASLSTVTPAVWKKATGCPADKGGARARAMQLFPTAADQFKRVKDDGRAEAALIGVYAVTRNQK
ncbi:uncharacterized protein LOC132797913 [Drosophila nasuta]|uniref:uncharacterized protein LOC132797913 n=1 Tax=Drosophila nasuta TaxID=42062 RepID=UPI00295E9FDD|nr:uncharacterized protein LOC132797913 [Drosophila nasuta]